MDQQSNDASVAMQTPKPGQPASRVGLSTFGSLHVRRFRFLWIANMGFFAAMQMQHVAQGWLVYEMTGDALMLGGISAATALSILVFSLFGGVVADRVVKRDLLVVAQLLLTAIALTIGMLITTDRIEYWHLLAGAIAFGAAVAFNMPCRHALVAEIVEERQLSNAVALNTAGMNVMQIGAPAIAGGLLAAVGADGVYFSIVICHLAVIAILLMIPRIEVIQRRIKTSILGDLREGLTYLKGVPTVLMLLVTQAAFFLIGMPFQMLMPVFARDVLAVGPEGLGTLLSAVGAGALLGSLTVATLTRLPYRGATLLGSGILFGLGLLCFSQSTSLIVSVGFLALAGIGSSGYMATCTALIIGMIAPAMRGRIMSLQMFVIGLQPLGTLPLSAIASAYGAPTAVGLGGTILITVMLTVALVRPSIRRLP